MRCLVLALTVSACATPDQTRDTKREVIDNRGWTVPGAGAVLDQLLADARAHGVDPDKTGAVGAISTITYDDRILDRIQEPGEHLAGVCETVGGPPPSRWRTAAIYLRSRLAEDPAYQVAVLYHELTHCIWGVGHWGSEFDLQYPIVPHEDDPWTDAAEDRWNLRVERHFDFLKQALQLKGVM